MSSSQAVHAAVLSVLRDALPIGRLDDDDVDRLAHRISAVVAPEAEGAERLDRMEAMLEALLWERRESRCLLRERPHDVHMLTGPHGARSAGAETLEEFLEGARSLVVADPYFYSFVKKYHPTADAYADELIDRIPRGLHKLDVFHNPGPMKIIRRRVQAFADEAGIQLRNYPTEEIHDRVWIRDGARAKVVGTSFGGLGRKLAFVLDLPPTDLEEFQHQLRRIRQNNPPLQAT